VPAHPEIAAGGNRAAARCRARQAARQVTGTEVTWRSCAGHAKLPEAAGHEQ
jgi:hypothetical protein